MIIELWVLGRGEVLSEVAQIRLFRHPLVTDDLPTGGLCKTVIPLMISPIASVSLIDPLSVEAPL